MTEDLPTGSYVCHCGLSFGSEMALEDHARLEHGASDAAEAEALTCPECAAVLGSPAHLEAHVAAHGLRPDGSERGA